MAYRDNHIASSCYLAQWAGDHGRLCAVRAEGGESRLKRPERVGFRPNFWGRDRGVRQHAEEHLNKIESDAAPVLRDLTELWPLEPGTRAWKALMLLIAVHLWRNPAGQRRFLELQQDSLARRLPQYEAEWNEDQVESFIAQVTSDRFRADTMLGDLNKAVSVLGSMNRRLVEFDREVLATSDQPVSVVPLLPRGESAPVAALPDKPLLDCEEIRLAVGPRHALVFTWHDEPSPKAVVRGRDEIAAQLNRAVIAQADRDWFHHPARRPTTLTPPDLGSKVCLPVGSRLIAGYGAEAARSSSRRADTAANVERMIEDEITDQIRVVRVRPVAAFE